MNDDRLHKLAERGIDEFRRFLIMFVYLWVVFGLFVLNETVILGERRVSFTAQGFALINAAVMAKIMLIAEALKLGRRFEHLPLIYPVVHKSAAFAAVFIAFHTLERILVGVLGGQSVVDSMPRIGGGSWNGVLTVWAIMAVSLLPFFALRELGRILGEGRLWSLMFRRAAEREKPAEAAAAAESRLC